MIFKHNPDGSVQKASTTRVDLSRMSEDFPKHDELIIRVTQKAREWLKAQYAINEMKKRAEAVKKEEKRKQEIQKLVAQLQSLKQVVIDTVYKGDEELYERTMEARGESESIDSEVI